MRGREKRERGRRHHSSFSCRPKSNGSERDEGKGKKEGRRKREPRKGSEGTNLYGPPFVPQSAAERRPGAFRTPWKEPWNAAVRRAGADGRSSDSTDGAKERMMIEWGKARHREGGDGKEGEPDTQRRKGNEEGRGRR